MSEDLEVDRGQARPDDDLDDDLDEELLSPGGRRPSLVTRILLALLICAVGVFIGVQVARLAGGSATGAAGADATGQSRRFGPPGAGSSGGAAAAAPRAASGSAAAPVATGEISRVRAHALVLVDQGASRTVTFTDDTTVTQPYGHGALGVGDAVTVFGSRAADGSVNATSIVVR
jgi:hypothetical protein